MDGEKGMEDRLSLSSPSSSPSSPSRPRPVARDTTQFPIRITSNISYSPDDCENKSIASLCALNFPILASSPSCDNWSMRTRLALEEGMERISSIELRPVSRTGRESTSESTIVPDKDPSLPLESKYAYTVSLCLAFFAVGLMQQSMSSSSADLAELSDGTLDDADYGFILLSIAYCLACFHWSAVHILVSRQTILTVSLIAISVTTIVMPFMRQVTNLWVTMAFTGFFVAGIEVSVIAWLIEMWGQGESASGCHTGLQSVFFAQSMGQVVAPLIVSPFLSRNLASHSHLRNGSYLSETTVVHVNDSFIIIPFSIVAVLVLLMAVMHCILLCKKPFLEKAEMIRQEIVRKKKQKDMNDNLNQSTYTSFRSKCESRTSNLGNVVSPESVAEIRNSLIVYPNDPNNNNATQSKTTNRTSPRVSRTVFDLNANPIIVFDHLTQQPQQKEASILTTALHALPACILVSSVSVISISCYRFLPRFVTSPPLDMHPNTADVLMTALAAVNCASRGLGVVLATEFTPRTVIFVDLCLMFVGNVTLYFFGQSSDLMVWISIFVLGSGMGNSIPAVIAFLEPRVPRIVSSLVTGVLMMGTRIPSILLYFTIRETATTVAFVYANWIAVGVAVLVMVLFILMGRKKNNEEETELIDKRTHHTTRM